MYTALDIVGLSLYAKESVPIKYQPWDDTEVKRMVQPGNLVGTVTSFVEPRAGRSELYWEFEDAWGILYYAPHRPGLYNLQKLRDQGLLTIQEQDIIDNYPEWYQLAGDVIGQAKGLIWMGAGLFVLVKVLPRLFKK